MATSLASKLSGIILVLSRSGAAIFHVRCWEPQAVNILSNIMNQNHDDDYTKTQDETLRSFLQSSYRRNDGEADTT